MNACNIKKEEFVFYCYEELSPERREEIKNHLVACRQCREEVQRLEKTILLVKQQKLKKIPSDILNNYTRQIKGRLAADEEKSFIPALKEKLFAWLENLRLGFYPQLMPAIAVLCVVVFVFAFMQYSRTNNFNLLNRELALLDSLGEEAEDIYSGGDEAGLAEEIESSDRLMLAQLDTEVEAEEVFDDAYILQELEEEDLNEEEVSDYLEIIDDIQEIGSAVS
ncbi:MAG: hypothetical protein Q8L26_05140 [Candidatus Omnitrophota bacterium]|nr:hypothetical protein [Candidatus Omnitrophota bacterium]